MTVDPLAYPTTSNPASPAVPLAPAVFTGLYLLVATIAAFATGNSEFLFYLVVMCVLAGLIVVAHRRVGFSAGLIWALSIWGALHMAGGLVPVPETWPINGDIRVLYSWWIIPAADGSGWLKYDHVVHAYGFGVATWACWQGLSSVAIPTGIRPTLGQVFIAALGGLGLGALNEVVEFIATLLTDTNVGGYVNTGWDLVANTTGASLAAMLIYTRGISR